MADYLPPAGRRPIYLQLAAMLVAVTANRDVEELQLIIWGAIKLCTFVLAAQEIDAREQYHLRHIMIQDTVKLAYTELSRLR